MLRLDIALLTILLYGDDRAQSESDELLVRLRDAVSMHPLSVNSLRLTLSCPLPLNSCNRIPDTSADNEARLADSDSGDELGALLGMVGKYHPRA